MNLKKPINRKLKLVVLSGAGISEESGIPTFRGSNGLWEGYNISEVATPEAWHNNYSLVLNFYNERRKNISEAKFNEAHKILAELESICEVQVITQNIDDLHERAGSKNVLHLHGEITKACSSITKQNVIEIGYNPIRDGQLSTDGSQLRPFIVWFGEEVPMINTAAKMVDKADALLIVGTSLEVYPAAGLAFAAKPSTPVIVIDPNSMSGKLNLPNKVHHIQEKATTGMRVFLKELNRILN